MCDWTKYFYFLVCKNLNSSFSTWLTHLILKVSLHSWLLWPTVQCAMRYIFDTWRNTNTEKSTHASFCPFLLLTLHGFFCAMRFTTVGHEIHELDFLEGSVSAIRRGRKAGRPRKLPGLFPDWETLDMRSMKAVRSSLGAVTMLSIDYSYSNRSLTVGIPLQLAHSVLERI